MESVFLVCAVIGGTLILCQFVMTLLGLAGDHDTGAGHGGDLDGHHDHGGAGPSDHDHGSSWMFAKLTLRTVTAAVAFFGLTGLAARRGGLDDVPTLALAIGAGVAAFWLVGWLMSFLHKLNVDGTVRIDHAVGCQGLVYLGIPAARAGLGKVHVNVLNRTVEYQAVTSQQALPTGAPIVVVAITGPDTVEVAPAQN